MIIITCNVLFHRVCSRIHYPNGGFSVKLVGEGDGMFESSNECNIVYSYRLVLCRLHMVAMIFSLWFTLQLDLWERVKLNGRGTIVPRREV